MKLRAKLILAFWGLAVVPLAAITLYSYISSLRALRSVAKEETSSMAADLGSRMESVSRDLNRQLEFIAAFEFRRIMGMDKKDQPAAMEALKSRLKAQMGDSASFLKSLEFTPSTLFRFGMPPMAVPKQSAKSKAPSQTTPGAFPVPALGTAFEGVPGAIPGGFYPGALPVPGRMWNVFRIEMPGAGPAPENLDKGQRPPVFARPFQMGRFSEVKNGSEILGKVSVEISSQRLLYHVLMRTQPRQGEIPFAMDAEGKLYATNPRDLQKVKDLPIPKPGDRAGDQRQLPASKNWVVATRKDPQSGLTFGIARPMADRLGELRNTAARNMGYGLIVIALGMVGIVPLSSRMTRNLTLLTRETENLGRGDFTARVQVSTKDEFGKLAHAFNRMAEDISKSQMHLIEQERIHKELEMCRKIQEELLPRHPLRSGIAEVKGISIPAREVGGDFFNYFPIPGGDNMALLVGDVSGKGLPAALLMANLQATIQARLPLELDLVKLAVMLDSEIAANNSEAYLTLFIAVLDPHTLKVRYVNAGHNPQLLLRREGAIERLDSTGRPLGLLAGGEFEEKSVQLNHGDSLFFYTDGLIEAQNDAGEEFGMTRLEQILVDARARGLDKMLVDVEQTIGRYRGKIEAADDATMMVLRIGNNV